MNIFMLPHTHTHTHTYTLRCGIPEWFPPARSLRTPFVVVPVGFSILLSLCSLSGVVFFRLSSVVNWLRSAFAVRRGPFLLRRRLPTEFYVTFTLI